MDEAVRGSALSLWLRLFGLSLIPLAVQGFFPGLGGAIGMLTPLPLAYGMCRRNIPEGSVAVMLVALVTSIAQGPGPGAYFLVETLPLCVGITWAVRSTEAPHIGVLKGLGLIALTACAALIAYSLITGKGPAVLYGETVGSMTDLMGTISGMDSLPAEQRAQVEWILGIWKRLFIGIWLATLMVLLVLFTVLIRSWLISAGLMNMEGALYLSRWAIPFPFIGVFALLSILILTGEGFPRDFGINLMIPLGTLYGIQGMAVLGHLYRKWSVSPLLRVLIIIFLAVYFPMFLIVGIALVGLFDTWFDLRRRFPHKMEGTPST
ncbi:MAG: DUF2232 domain-containing protein [bacterium]|nr:MAG: DUF2232 domain-containing protein [bacterium]